MFMKGMFMLFMSLGLGYILCILADKQKGILRTVGYTLGIAIMVLSLVYELCSQTICGPCKMHKMSQMKCGKAGFAKGMIKHHPARTR